MASDLALLSCDVGGGENTESKTSWDSLSVFSDTGFSARKERFRVRNDVAGSPDCDKNAR